MAEAPRSVEVSFGRPRPALRMRVPQGGFSRRFCRDLGNNGHTNCLQYPRGAASRNPKCSGSRAGHRYVPNITSMIGDRFA